MSSSGLIYAFIVGAWAVYLVPMWLRREDELNEARQTRRYTTAIKVLSHKDSFERRYGRTGEGTDEARLPAAVGQGAAPEAGRDTLERVRAKEREQTRRTAGSARDGVRGSARDASADRRGAPAAGAAKPGRSRKPASAAVPAASSSVRRSVVHASVAGVVASGGSMSAASGAPGMPIGAMNATSPMLRARRRRVVGVLFAVTSLGAIVSMDLGLRFVWAMLLPAAVLSAYIVWVRKDERARAADRARHRAAAARAAREAREAQRRDREEFVRAEEEREAFEREEQARRETTARRRAAAARSRAERRVSGPGAAPANPATDPRDLPRAANG
ncbi:hypothetical protein [Actinospica robiniae]|uniref:hypothetical protein n=1 Tax=Actinospica robiniae TaxID=304901 RepID=UPI00040985F0|nr:hypothetical protein [Actinospica robiniae]